MYSWNNWL
jgi:hypothetical protein